MSTNETYISESREPGQPSIVENQLVQPASLAPGKLGELADYLFSYAASPVDEYALATAIGFYAGICGRSWGINGTGLNHDIIVLGKSGTGKNVVHQGIGNIAKQLGSAPIGRFICNAHMASAPALLKFVATNPCSVQLISEIAGLYRAYSKCRYGDNIYQLMKLKLDLWERSGPDSMSVGIHYSDADKSVAGSVIAGIAHSTIGESTPEDFYGALSTDNMNEGILSRLWIFQYEGSKPAFNMNREERLPEPLREHLSNLVQNASGRLVTKQQPVQCSPEAGIVFSNCLMLCNESEELAENPATHQLWVRGYEKVLRLAALCAVADNFHHPVVSHEHAYWAYKVLRRTNTNILGRIGEEIADDSDHTRQEMVRARIRRWLETPRRDPKDESLRKQRIVTKRFLQQETSNLAVFKKFRGGSNMALDLTIRNLADTGYLFEPKKGDVKVPGKGIFGPTEEIYHGKCWRVLE